MRIGRSMSVCGRLDNEGTHPSSFVLCTLPITKDKGRKTKDGLARGFTILELMVVLTLILIIISIATPMYQAAIQRAREAVLRDNLYTMRKASTSVQRRSRVKVNALVSPSPVGLAMEKEVYPSPP